MKTKADKINCTVTFENKIMCFKSSYADTAAARLSDGYQKVTLSHYCSSSS